MLEFAAEESFLYAVDEKEEPVRVILDSMTQALTTNFVGPNKYLALYERYYYILNGSAERELMDFFKIEPFPFLKASRQIIIGCSDIYIFL